MIELDVVRRPGSGKVGTIGLVTRDRINAATVMSLLSLQQPPGVDVVMNTGNVLPFQRNHIVQNMGGDWLLFIDADMVFQPDALMRLLDTRRDLEDAGRRPDIVGALCFRRTPPHEPTLLLRDKPGEGPYHVMADYPEAVVEVDATGMAFALIDRRAFELLAGGAPMPPLEERLTGKFPAEFFRWHGNLGEDIRFCHDLKAAGGSIWVDTRVKTKHIFEHQIGESEWRKP